MAVVGGEWLAVNVVPKMRLQSQSPISGANAGVSRFFSAGIEDRVFPAACQAMSINKL